MVRRKRGRYSWIERACWYPSSQFCRSVYTLCLLWNEGLVSNVLLCLCTVSERRKEARASF